MHKNFRFWPPCTELGGLSANAATTSLETFIVPASVSISGRLTLTIVWWWPWRPLLSHWLSINRLTDRRRLRVSTEVVTCLLMGCVVIGWLYCSLSAARYVIRHASHLATYERAFIDTAPLHSALQLSLRPENVHGIAY